MDKIAMRANLIDAAIQAHEGLRHLWNERVSAPIPPSQYIAQLDFQPGLAMRATFKHIQMDVEVRPVLTGHNESAMEYSFFSAQSGEKVEIGVLYLVAHEGTISTDPKGDKNVLGNIGNYRVIDAIGGWLSDQVESATKLLTPKVGSGSIVGIYG
jgi:hypothetical protein